MKRSPFVPFGFDPATGEYHGQAAVLAAKAKVVAAVAGHFGGKSQLGPTWLLDLIKQWPGDDFIVLGPTLKTLRKSAVPKLEEAFVRLGYRWRFDQQRNYGYRAETQDYTLPADLGGGKIYFASARSPVSVQGAHVRAWWMDETEGVPYAVFEMLMTRIAGLDGRGLITSTPYDLGWLFEEVYQPWVKAGRPDWRKAVDVFVETWPSIANPTFPPEQWERERKRLPDWLFRMRYEGSFEQPAGLVYDFSAKWVPPFSTSGLPMLLGLDFGSEDPFACIWIASNKIGAEIAFYVADEFKQSGWLADGASGTLPSDMIDAVVERCRSRGDNVQAVYCDPARPDLIEYARRAFAAAGVCDVVEAAANSVLPGLERVTGLLRTDHLFGFDNLPHFRDEIAHYSWRVSQDGKPIRMGQPIKQNDHLMDAMRYALMGNKTTAAPEHVGLAFGSLNESRFTFPGSQSARAVMAERAAMEAASALPVPERPEETQAKAVLIEVGKLQPGRKRDRLIVEACDLRLSYLMMGSSEWNAEFGRRQMILSTWGGSIPEDR